jgi:beta-galactosidase
MILGSHYYRAPFPLEKYWEDDLAAMKDSGLNTVQLWVVWAWVEPRPGDFDFSDYDRLIEIAAKNGLKVVLSTIAAIHPLWIHDEAEGSEMITNMGQKVISSSRRECHFGLTPGGCIDHPKVMELISRFLQETAQRYVGIGHLAGWDVWNELRWNVHSDGLVCYCPHTIKKFQDRLREQFGSLENLNKAWHRRYATFEQVMPGKRPGRVYTEMTAFEEFITARSVEFGQKRYSIIKKIDPKRPVTVHGGKPTVLYGSDTYLSDTEPSTVLHRGNDWDFADGIDGIGTSSFPVWEEIDEYDFTARIAYSRSAARGRELWLSELQGGRAATGFDSHKAVEAAVQQRWLWNGIAQGATAVLFWCWRDEVFGRESAGFGLSGADGKAGERLEAMRETSRIIEANQPLLQDYMPEKGRVGVWFSPSTYYLEWAERGAALSAMESIGGYVRALLRNDIAFRVVEEKHLDELKELGVLFMPRCLVLPPEAEEALLDYLSDGGILVVESEFGAFNTSGIYLYPNERFLARTAEIEEAGRRELSTETIKVYLAGSRYTVGAEQWLTPYRIGGGESVVIERPVGNGKVIGIGSYLGAPYYRMSRGFREEFQEGVCGFERLLRTLCSKAGQDPSVEILRSQLRYSRFAHVRRGQSENKTVLFVCSDDPNKEITLRINDIDDAGRFEDIVNGGTYMAHMESDWKKIVLKPSRWGIHFLVENA